jgi:predicted nucleic acid-binding protein
VRLLFVDTSYFVAIFNDDDEWHDRALELGDELAASRDVRFLTITNVLGEFLTSMSKRHEAIKREAVEFVRDVLLRPQIDVVSPDTELFEAAVAFYHRRLDKQYSLVDCLSMVVCQSRSINEVLTADHDFEQERLVALLRT